MHASFHLLLRSIAPYRWNGHTPLHHFLAQMFAVLPSQMFHNELADLKQEIGDDSSQVKRRGRPEAGEGPAAP